MKASQVTVEVVFARPERQVLPAGSTVEDAVAASGLTGEIGSLGPGRIGIHGKAVPARTVVRDGDRVEIYRPLLADPKDLRRRRAAKTRGKS